KLDWIVADTKHYWDRRGRGFRSERCGSAGRGDDNAHTTTDQIVDQFRQSVVLTFRPTVLDRHILAPDKTGLTEAPPKCGQPMNVTLRNPLTGVAGGCARAASGQAAAAPPSVAKNLRRPRALAM